MTIIQMVLIVNKNFNTYVVPLLPRVQEGSVSILSVYLCVCLSVRAITFECLDIESSCLVSWHILTIFRSSLSTEVIRSRSRSLL